jgi:hypothetical protein
LTRHKKVAEAIVVVSEGHFGTDLEDIWSRLIEHVVRLGRNGEVSRECHGPIIHSGAHLKRDLPQALNADRRGEIGIAAAEAACSSLPERIDVVTDLARALRIAGKKQHLEQACRLMSENVAKLDTAVDRVRCLRSYHYEWSTCTGNLNTRQGSIMNAWLATFSLSDALKVEVTNDDAKLSCAGLGVAFKHLFFGDPNEPFAKGRRAATEIGWRTNPDPRTAGYFERHERELDELATPKPADLDEAMAWLADAAHAAYRELDDPQLRDLHGGGRLAFTRLRAAVAD